MSEGLVMAEPESMTSFLKELVCKIQEKQEVDLRQIRSELNELRRNLNELEIKQAEAKTRLGFLLAIAATIGAGIAQLFLGLLKIGAKP